MCIGCIPNIGTVWVCVCVCVCVYVCTCMSYVCQLVHMCVRCIQNFHRVCLCMYVCMYVDLDGCMNTCVYKIWSRKMLPCLYISIQCIQLNYIYIYIYIYTSAIELITRSNSNQCDEPMCVWRIHVNNWCVNTTKRLCSKLK